MTTTVTMSRTDYEALVDSARQNNQAAALVIRDRVDSDNAITRYVLLVRWKNVGGQPPSRVDLFKNPWPPSMTATIELDRKVSRDDVDQLLATRATNPTATMVTPDPQGIVGWTFIDDYTF